jgi:hypothetical protein
MEQPTTPEHSRVKSIQLESVGRTPSHSTSHFDSSTTVAEARENLVASLTSRMTFNDEDVVDVLIKPYRVDDGFVDKVVGGITQRRDFTTFLSILQKQDVERESEMYKPLVSALTTL